MVKYDPKDWITFIFRFHKSDTFRQLFPMMIFIGLYSAGICFLEVEYCNFIVVGLPNQYRLRSLVGRPKTLGVISEQ
jgi:hypothetical protein